MSQVAQTILNQLGGIPRLVLMTGANNFAASEDTVTFKIGKGAKNKINTVRIKLNAMDTYDVEFIRVWGTNITVVDKTEGAYNDMLVDLFENATGFYLTL